MHCKDSASDDRIKAALDSLVGEESDLTARDVETLLLRLREEGTFIHSELRIVNERVTGVVILLRGVLLQPADMS